MFGQGGKQRVVMCPAGWGGGSRDRGWAIIDQLGTAKDMCIFNGLFDMSVQICPRQHHVCRDMY
ncbi:MAG: hypothetical protein CTY20_02625 [Hyphomicrobium sp.]|nr:MAG: hypothetical protein CTY20_02625 [Hyphomicrobium sp.]